MTERSGIICAGNWIVDLVHDIEHWPAESNLTRITAQSRGIGGGAANVIAALSRLETGVPLWPMGAIGDDDYGQFILDQCRALRLPTEQLNKKAGIPTAHTHVMSVAGRSRTFFYQGGANDALSAVDFPIGTFAETPARLFYMGYLTLLGALDEFDEDGSTGAAKVLQRARLAGLVTCVDLVSMPHPGFPEIVASAAPYIDYLIINEVEAAHAIGSNVSKTEVHHLTHVAQELLKLRVCKAVVVHCVERVIWAHVDGTILVVEVSPEPPERIVSNLGAGDAFCAGLMYGIHQGWQADQSIQLAIKTAAVSLKGHTATEAIPPLATLLKELA